ncbi:hypothetical protein JXA47_00965 [Candidatus Sumerlaeota bacterium]|nr:hypothetical protein [Candidatus Sumerlaeota bacterium]
MPSLPTLQATVTPTAISPEAELARTGLMDELIDVGLWAAVVLVAVFLGVKIVRLLFFKPNHGAEMSPMGIDGLLKRGVIDQEEYQAIRRSLSERMAARLAEEARRREEERLSRDPIAAIAAKARAEREESAPAPPSPEEGEITEAEIARLNRLELERRQRRAAPAAPQTEAGGNDTPPPPPPPPPPRRR